MPALAIVADSAEAWPEKSTVPAENTPWPAPAWSRKKTAGEEPDGDDQTWALPEQPFEQRWHFDVWVAHDEGERRLQAGLDAGGRLVSDRAAHEFHLGARFTFHVEDALASIGHFDQGVSRVVLRHLFAGLLWDMKAEESSARVVRREVHAYGRRLSVGRQRHLL